MRGLQIARAPSIKPWSADAHAFVARRLRGLSTAPGTT